MFICVYVCLFEYSHTDLPTSLDLWHKIHHNMTIFKQFSQNLNEKYILPSYCHFEIDRSGEKAIIESNKDVEIIRKYVGKNGR